MTLFERIQDLATRWAPHREGLLKAIERTNGTHTEDDIMAMILGNKLDLVVSEKSACVLETISYPRMNVLNVFLASGDLDDIIEHEPKIAEIAKQRNCTRMTLGGREGWKVALAASGYKPGGSFMYRDL